MSAGVICLSQHDSRFMSEVIRTRTPEVAVSGVMSKGSLRWWGAQLQMCKTQ